jgi:hypothetical protein
MGWHAELVSVLKKFHIMCANSHEQGASGHLVPIAGGRETGSTKLVAYRTMRADPELGRACADLH